MRILPLFLAKAAYSAATDSVESEPEVDAQELNVQLKTTSVLGDIHFKSPPQHVPWGHLEPDGGRAFNHTGHHHTDNSHEHNHLWKKERHIHPDENPCQEGVNCYGKCNANNVCAERTCYEGRACAAGRCTASGECETDMCRTKYRWRARHSKIIQTIGTCEGDCVRDRLGFNRPGRKDKRASWCNYNYKKIANDVQAACTEENCPGGCVEAEQGQPLVCQLNVCTQANCRGKGHCVNGFCVKNTCAKWNCHHGVCRKNGLCVTKMWTDYNHQHGNQIE